MILIADSGSTKTDWRLIDDDKHIHQFTTIGFNPYWQDTETIYAELKNNLLPKIKEVKSKIQDPRSKPETLNLKLETVFFYGAGCSTSAKTKVVEDALKKCFSDSIIEVQHDLLAAAHALCGNDAGIASILGTGSNSCYYDGKKIAEHMDSLGFLLGDEGSGAHIGKTFIQAFLNRELPKQIEQQFSERYKLSKEEILDTVYKKPMPNKFMASFSKFVYQNIKEQYMVDLVVGCFNQFFDKHICKYTKYKEVPFHCVGSVGFYYSNLLRRVAEQRGIKVGKIIETPIAALTLYHAGE